MVNDELSGREPAIGGYGEDGQSGGMEPALSTTKTNWATYVFAAAKEAQWDWNWIHQLDDSLRDIARFGSLHWLKNPQNPFSEPEPVKFLLCAVSKHGPFFRIGLAPTSKTLIWFWEDWQQKGNGGRRT